MQELLDKVVSLGEKFLNAEGEEAEKVRLALEAGRDALGTASKLLDAYARGDRPVVVEQLSKWKDVQETYEAISVMERAIEDSKAAIQLDDVLEVIQVVAKIVVTLKAVAL